MARGDKPSADRKLSLKERRLAKKSAYKKPKQTKSRKPVKAKYVSTQYTLADDPIVHKDGEIIEVNRSGSEVDEELNKDLKVKNTQNLRTFIRDATGKMFKVKDQDVITNRKWKNDGTIEQMPDQHLGTFTSEDLAKRYPSKTAGTQVNEVYKLRNIGDMGGPKEGYDIDIKRRVSRSNRATDLQMENPGGESQSDKPLTATETDYAKTMEVEKFRGKGGSGGFNAVRRKADGSLKRKKYKSKKYVSKADMGGTKSYQFEEGTYEGDGKVTPGRFTQTGGHENTKKEMRDQGYKVISDRRYDRIANRHSQYKDNKMAQGMNQAAGGISGTKSSYANPNQEQLNKRSFSEGVARLFSGEWKGSDLYKRRKGK